MCPPRDTAAADVVGPARLPHSCTRRGSGGRVDHPRSMQAGVTVARMERNRHGRRRFARRCRKRCARMGADFAPVDASLAQPAGARSLNAALKAPNCSLTHLDLRNNRLAPSGVMILAEALQHNASLKSLDLRWNGAGDEGAKHLEGALAANHTLLRLPLQGAPKPVAGNARPAPSTPTCAHALHPSASPRQSRIGQYEPPNHQSPRPEWRRSLRHHKLPRTLGAARE